MHYDVNELLLAYNPVIRNSGHISQHVRGRTVNKGKNQKGRSRSNLL